MKKIYNFLLISYFSYYTLKITILSNLGQIWKSMSLQNDKIRIGEKLVEKNI